MLYPLKETISKLERAKLFGHNSGVIWLTGLSGSGKSTLAVALEKELIDRGVKAYLLDGDSVRSGLNKDLGFAETDRRENIRRVGEVCRLMDDAGLVVITAFISPFKAERDFVRALLPANHFAEVFVNTPLAVCEKRDVKGLYEKAKKGLLSGLSGIDSPYEPPVNCELEIHTEKEPEEESVKKLLDFVLARLNFYQK